MNAGWKCVEAENLVRGIRPTDITVTRLCRPSVSCIMYDQCDSCFNLFLLSSNKARRIALNRIFEGGESLLLKRYSHEGEIRYFTLRNARHVMLTSPLSWRRADVKLRWLCVGGAEQCSNGTNAPRGAAFGDTSPADVRRFLFRVNTTLWCSPRYPQCLNSTNNNFTGRWPSVHRCKNIRLSEGKKQSFLS